MADTDDPLFNHLAAASSRSMRSLDEAQRLADAGFFGPALVWAVRSAEIFMRDFVLTPHFLETREPWSTAMKKGSRVLGTSNWEAAFAKAEEWWGPFDEPLTETDRNAWNVWSKLVLRRRGDIIHGKPVTDIDDAAAREVLTVVGRMMEWYTQRFLVSERHPIGTRFRATFAAMRDASPEQRDDGP